MSVSDSPEKNEGMPTLDARAAALVARKISRSGQPWLHDEVARRMAERLPLIRQPTQHWVNWAPRIGGRVSHTLVQALYPHARQTVVQTEADDLIWAKQALSPPWWKRLTHRGWDFSSDTTQAADLVWCNMQLHMNPDPLFLMQQWHQTLNAQGHVMFSCLGPDSLRELRTVFAQQGWPEPHHPFTDMHDWGDMLLQAGFAQPIMDMEHITLTYATADDLLGELRTLGRNLHPQRLAGLRGRAWQRRLLNGLQGALLSSAHEGRLTLTFEVIYGHAFKAKPATKPDPSTTVSLDAMKKMLSGKGKTL